MRLLYALLLSALLLPSARAQTPGSCELGRAERDLSVSDVLARVFNAGNLFFGNSSEAAYVVPQESGNSPVYAAGVWAGGTVGGDLRVAGSTFGDFEYWPGPLTDGGELPNPDDCSAYDRIYVLTALDVEQYEDTGVASADLAGWPVGQGAPAVDARGNPIVSDDIDRVLNLSAGERPVIYGSQTAFWVMNDVGNDKPNLGTAPLGIQVAVTAFSVISDEAALDQATVYRYAFTNKSPTPIDGFTAGLFSDADLGSASDDRVGVDTTRAMAFAYNANNDDAQYGIPPAVGVDLLDGSFLGSSYFTNGATGVTSDPTDATGYYNRLLGLWNDGTPITEGGDGFESGGPVLSSTWPGDPVTNAFWSEENLDGNGTTTGSGADRRFVTYATAATLAPGATRTLDLAIVFAQGSDRLDSVTELRAASDRVQAAYDDGSLFAPAEAPARLATPELLSPEDGADVTGPTIVLDWTDVPDAEKYIVETSRSPDFPTAPFPFTVTRTQVVTESEVLFQPFVVDEPDVAYWRVRAEAPGALSFPSETRSFTYFSPPTQPDFKNEGRGIVEVARPDGAVCPDGSDDFGCERDLGNTVFLDPDAAGDYYVGTDTDAGIARLRRYVASGAPADFEMRFTDAGGYGIEFGVASDGPVWRVPFELWNVGDLSDASDDIRMIPMLIREEGTDYDWADTFPRIDPVSGAPASARVYWMMPDRPDGYALFETAAIAAGVGQPFVDSDVTNTPIDPDALLVGDTDPSTGQVCENTGGYVSFCYRNTETSPLSGANAPGGTFVYPIGRVTLVDLAGDGTTPPAGTVIRFLTTDVGDFAVADEDGPVAREGVALLAVRPNPNRGAAVVPFALSSASAVRMTVADVLGRQVAVLAEGDFAAGAHEAAFDGRGLASGVYVVVLEAGGARLTRTVTVAR